MTVFIANLIFIGILAVVFIVIGIMTKEKDE